MTDNEKRICEVIFDEFPGCLTNSINKSSDLTPELSLTQDLGFDSLDLIELVMELEEEFDVEISDDDASSCKTIKDCFVLAEKLLE